MFGIDNGSNDEIHQTLISEETQLTIYNDETRKNNNNQNICLEFFDSVISTEAAYHDVASNILTEFHPWLETVYFKADQELLNLTRKAVSKIAIEGKVYWGRMVTGEAFIEDEGRQIINE